MSARIGINLLWLVPDAVGGSEESTVATLRALHALSPSDLDLQLFALAAFGEAHPDVVTEIPTELVSLSGRSRAARIAGESSWLASHTRGLDLVHHAGGTAPPLRTAPYVLTVHDLQPLERQATHGRGKRAYLRVAIPPSVRHARAVAVPSEFVRRSLVAATGVDPARVVTVPHGVEPPQPVSDDEISVVRDRFDLHGPVVLYPAITYPHKNHATLVAAFAAVRSTHPTAVLMLTGAPGASDDDVVAQVVRLGLADGVRRPGRVSAAVLAALYHVADVVAVPSLYEGFGLPAAEAMAAGVPLVAARTTALPEVVGDAGILVAPHDVTAWSDAIIGLLDRPDEAAALGARGRERATQYSWTANAEGFAALYRMALEAG